MLVCRDGQRPHGRQQGGTKPKSHLRRTSVLARQILRQQRASAESKARRWVYLGTDSGATTSKTGGIWADGTIISHELRQSSTNSAAGRAAVITGWVDGIKGFLADNDLTWEQVKGVGK